jgi:hypothetical protein
MVWVGWWYAEKSDLHLASTCAVAIRATQMHLLDITNRWKWLFRDQVSGESARDGQHRRSGHPCALWKFRELRKRCTFRFRQKNMKRVHNNRPELEIWASVPYGRCYWTKRIFWILVLRLVFSPEIKFSNRDPGDPYDLIDFHHCCPST